jgi:hypothetical protein
MKSERRWGWYPAVFVIGLGVAVACGDDGGGDTASGGDGATPSFGLDDLSDDAEVTELTLDLPDDFDQVAGVAAVDDDVIAATGNGVVVRSTDGDEWEQVDDVEGLGDSVYALTPLDDALIALTGDGLLRSDDGITWEQIETSGVDVADLNTMTQSDSGLVAIGGDSNGFTQFVSEDGEEWESEVTDGLADSDTYQGQFVVSLAAVGDDLVASLGAEFEGSSDDVVFGIWTSSDGGIEWDEVGTGNDVEGLEELELPNTDAQPILVAVDDGFLALAGDGDGEAMIWRSEDGEEWGDAIALGGPDLSFPYEIDAATATGDAVVATVLLDDELTVWTLSAD